MSVADYARRFVHPEDSPLVAEETRKAVESDDPKFSRCLEHRMLYADGSPGHIAVRFFVVKDSERKTVKTFGVNQDITERKQAEEEREKLQSQLLQSRKMESIGRLAGGVALDYNNMLSVIISFAELAMDKAGPDDPLQEELKEIINTARRSADITRQLLAFARQQTIDPMVINLNENVEGMLKMLRRLIGEDINLSWHPGLDLESVFMDPSQLNQILVNLCINARDAIGGVGKITIETDNVRFDAEYLRRSCRFYPRRLCNAGRERRRLRH